MEDNRDAWAKVVQAQYALMAESFGEGFGGIITLAITNLISAHHATTNGTGSHAVLAAAQKNLAESINKALAQR